MLTTFRVYPDQDLAVVVLTNGMRKGYGLDEVADSLALAYVSDLFDPVDTLAYQAKHAYMAEGLGAARRSLAAAEITDVDMREVARWLADEIAHMGDEENSTALHSWAQFAPLSLESIPRGH